MNLPAPTASGVHFASDYIPQDNFGNRGNNPESEMADAFSFAYFHRYARLRSSPCLENLHFLREFPVSGLGIADLIAVSQSSSSFTIRAFELKIDDWRRGMSQAFRYKYYADASILVVPMKKVNHVAASLPVFKKLDVGIWGFDQARLTISPVFTPRPKKKFSAKFREVAEVRIHDCITGPQPTP